MFCHETVPCRECGAKSGDPCLGKRGKPVLPHKDRMRVWAKGGPIAASNPELFQFMVDRCKLK